MPIWPASQPIGHPPTRPHARPPDRGATIKGAQGGPWGIVQAWRRRTHTIPNNYKTSRVLQGYMLLAVSPNKQRHLE
jgi:hypothetical protein